MTTWPESKHFSFERLADGIYAAISVDSGLAVGNAGILDLGDSTVIFDTFSSHIAAADLRAAAIGATGKEPDDVVLSHAHRDHTKGTQVFKSAAIISTTRTREIMALRLQARTERVNRDGLDAIRRDIDVEFDEWVRNPLTTPLDKLLWESYRQSLLQGIEDYALVLPDVGFDSSLTLYGAKRKAEATTFGGGHSDSDAILYLPNERVVFMGDILFIGYQPYVGDGDLQALLKYLDRVEALDPRIVVPGHGPVGSPKDIAGMKEYLFALEKEVDEMRQSGGGPEEARGQPLPTRFEGLKWAAFWRANLEELHKKATDRGK